MSTYYTTLTVPTATIGDNFTLGLWYDSSQQFEAASGGLVSDLTAAIAAMQAIIGGTLTYTSVTSGTDTIYRFTSTAPTIAPTVIELFNNTLSQTVASGFDLVQDCTGCVAVEWNQCEESYDIDLGLSGTTEYDYLLQSTQTGIHYGQTSTTSAGGVTTWDASVMPELYVNGSVYVLTATLAGTEVVFQYNGTQYSCVQITIVNQTDITPSP